MGFKSGLSKFSRGFMNIVTCNSTKRFGKRPARESNTARDGDSEKPLGSRSNLTNSTLEPITEVSPSTENMSALNAAPVNNANAAQIGPNYGIYLTSEELRARYGAIITALEEALGQTLHVPEGRSSADTTFPIVEALFAIAEQSIALQKIANGDSVGVCVRELAQFKRFFQHYGATSAVKDQATNAEKAPLQDRPIPIIANEAERPSVG